jgi:hypothetical protein
MSMICSTLSERTLPAPGLAFAAGLLAGLVLASVAGLVTAFAAGLVVDFGLIGIGVAWNMIGF